MPISGPPGSRPGAANSTPPSPVSSEDDGAGKTSFCSLLSSNLHQSSPSFREENGIIPASRRSGIPQRTRRSSETNDTTTDQSPVADNLSPWEKWFLCKEKKLRARLQAQALEEMHQQMEKRKENQECEKRKTIAKEKHKQWVQRKNEEVKRERRERERKLSKEIAEKASKELEKAQSEQKAKEVYEEWLKKKKTEEVQKKKDEREKEKQQEAELQEKKQKSERMFKEWLQHTRTKSRPASASYACANGRLAGYPDGNAYPAPAFYNPIPWKPIHMPHPNEDKYVSVKKNKRPISSQTHRSSSVLFHKSKNNLFIGSLCKIQR